MKKIILLLIPFLLAANYPHNDNQKKVTEEVNSLASKNASQEVCVFQVESLTEQIEFTLFGQNKIKATGAINKTWNTIADLIPDFDAFVLTHPDVLESELPVNGYLYVKYGNIDGNATFVEKEEQRFLSAAHLFDHLIADLKICGAN